MTNYLIRRLLLLPITLFAIILVNFVILNLAPGDPVTLVERSSSGEASRSADSASSFGENQYLSFREHYGLTLPIIFNLWPNLTYQELVDGIYTLTDKETPSDVKHSLFLLWGDRARFVMPLLLRIAMSPDFDLKERALASNLFIRGGTRQGKVGSNLSEEEKLLNQSIAETNIQLRNLRVLSTDTESQVDEKAGKLKTWFDEQNYTYPLSFSQKVKTFFFETRFSRYLKRVVTLDFGTLRNDTNKSVLSEVASRIKYSLTLAIIPMLITFFLCQLFGMVMAIKQNQFLDISLNTLFLILFAIPIFVVAPFLIEKFAIGKFIPFTHISIPTSGFHSPQATYDNLTTIERLGDISLHIFLPFVAIIYGTLALQSRLSRTAILEVLRQDYVKTAKAKGLPLRTVLVKHVGRNAAITIVTSLATSLGVILGGSLIVETLFEINGFGRFFYEAIVNRDYNVMLFSVFAGSFLALVGYLLADIAYTLLDPRVSLE